MLAQYVRIRFQELFKCNIIKCLSSRTSKQGCSLSAIPRLISHSRENGKLRRGTKYTHTHTHTYTRAYTQLGHVCDCEMNSFPVGRASDRYARNRNGTETRDRI